jgi:hypothetical protein
MLDRFLSGAGAMAHAADRLVAAFFRGGALGNAFRNRVPGSLIAAALLGLGALLLGNLGLESVANPTPRALTPTEVHTATDLGGRTFVRMNGVLLSDYVETYEDKNDNGHQDTDETGRAWYYFMRGDQDPRGLVVRSKRTPETISDAVAAADPEASFLPIEMTGMLREDSKDIADALSAEGLDRNALEAQVSDRYLLDDGAEPTSAAFAFPAAVGLGLLGLLILIGLVARYLVFRSEPQPPLVSSQHTLATGDAIPLHVTGRLQTNDGTLERVREAKASLRRVLVSSPEAPVDATAATPVVQPQGPADSTGGAPVLEPRPTDSTGQPSTDALVLAREDGKAGLDLGRGDVQSAQLGRAVPFGGPRPALRIGTRLGPLVLSFDNAAARDRAWAEIRAETGAIVGSPGMGPS